VVCYHGDFFSMVIAWLVIRVKFISLVNLIMGREVVKELIQYDLSRKKLATELQSVLPGGIRRKMVLDDYKSLKQILGDEGASGRVAEDMVRTLGG